MNIGYILENFDVNLSPDYLLQTALYAEKLGFHSIWTTDHIMQPVENRLTIYNRIVEAISTLLFLAGHTKNVKLGISTLVLPIRNTILVAKQLATLDYLTNGRLISSFGAGWNKDEFEFMGMNFSNRGKRMNEQLQVIRSLWQGEQSFEGKYHSYTKASFEPRSDTLANSPILVAGNSEHALKRGVTYGTGWHPSGMKPDDIKKALEPYQEQLKDKTFDIWIRVAYLPQVDYATFVPEYEKLGVTGLVFDCSKEKEKNPLDQMSALMEDSKNW